MRQAEALKLIKGELVEVELDSGEWVKGVVTEVDSFEIENEVSVRVDIRPTYGFPHNKVRWPK